MSAATSNSKKRKLFDGPGAPDLESRPEKSSKFWFTDGNVVLQTAETKYRVHRGVLAFHSTVFADMFALPQPEDAEEALVEGCDLVPVTDSTKDWDILLGILYHSAEYTIPETGVIMVNVMLTMLRLGQKYNFEAVKTQALKQVKSVFPNSLEGWAKIWQHGRYADNAYHHSIEHIFAVLSAIEEMGIRTALPMGYYSCLRVRSFEQIIDGRDDRDGPVYLSQKTRNLLILATPRLLKDYNFSLYAWLKRGTPSKSCKSPKECLPLIAKFLSDVMETLSTKPHSALDHMTIEPYFLFDEPPLCDTCNSECTRSFEKARASIFKRLPSYFDLPPWDELEDD